MSSSKLPVSLQSYAFRLRKTLLNGVSLQNILDYHNHHQEVLGAMAPVIDVARLSLADRFAWKFIKEINILSLNFSKRGNTDLQESLAEPRTGKAVGVYQNLMDVIRNVQSIWFPEMDDFPNICWLKQYTTRKLAHYSFKNDEIAFSLIFDFLEVPAEILSYLAYHELLHRQLGTRQVNGRRYAHTREFKHQEQLFPNWREIEKKINDYILHTQ
ncbi:MAG: hypothetical protein GY866_02425 [Proteobacteria bacterium]|nr:hypothetical protein [Pseudomonadota bacterium]